MSQCSNCGRSTACSCCPSCGNETYCDYCGTCNVCPPGDIAEAREREQCKRMEEYRNLRRHNQGQQR